MLAAPAPLLIGKLHRREPSPPVRLVLMLLLIELRSGRSVLGSLQAVGAALSGWRELTMVVRVATVSGLTHAVEHAGDMLRPVIVQLARAQRSGAPLGDTVRRALERDLAEERARKLARARALPVKLMVPVALLMLPGLVLMIYGPSLLEALDDLTGGFL